MKKTKRTLFAMLMVTIVLLPACRTRKTPAPVTEPAVTEAPAPEVAAPPSQDTTVDEPTDFVQETPEPVEETFPTDINRLNEYLQERGYVRDAFFHYDASTLDDAAQTALTSSANWLRSPEGRGYNVLIEGHCDERGTEQYNLALGDRRANTAREYLMTLGIDASRIRTVSYGEERPFESGSSEAAWAQNRRAHLVVTR
jgi:peptidoglycan-associated lipoprotein